MDQGRGTIVQSPFVLPHRDRLLRTRLADREVHRLRPIGEVELREPNVVAGAVGTRLAEDDRIVEVGLGRNGDRLVGAETPSLADDVLPGARPLRLERLFEPSEEGAPLVLVPVRAAEPMTLGVREGGFVDQVPDHPLRPAEPFRDGGEVPRLPRDHLRIEVRTRPFEGVGSEGEEGEDHPDPVTLGGEVVRLEGADPILLHPAGLDEVPPATPDSGPDPLHAEGGELREGRVPLRRVRLLEKLSVHRPRHDRRPDPDLRHPIPPDEIAVDGQLRTALERRAIEDPVAALRHFSRGIADPRPHPVEPRRAIGNRGDRPGRTPRGDHRGLDLPPAPPRGSPLDGDRRVVSRRPFGGAIQSHLDRRFLFFMKDRGRREDGQFEGRSDSPSEQVGELAFGRLVREQAQRPAPSRVPPLQTIDEHRSGRRGKTRVVVGEMDGSEGDEMRVAGAGRALFVAAQLRAAETRLEEMDAGRGGQGRVTLGGRTERSPPDVEHAPRIESEMLRDRHLGGRRSSEPGRAFDRMREDGTAEMDQVSAVGEEAFDHRPRLGGVRAAMAPNEGAARAECLDQRGGVLDDEDLRRRL